MKRTMSVILVSFLALAVVFAGGASEKDSAQKTYRILSGSGAGNAVYDIFDKIVQRYQSEVNPDFKVEWEVISSTSDLWQKLQMYNTANNLPDIFACSNGAMSEEMVAEGKLVNMTKVLTAVGHLDDVSDSMVDYFTSSDGNMYMVPSTFSGEFFVYRKPTFERLGLKPPKTWNEFIDVCQKLKDAGEQPYVMRGADYVQYLRFLSFPTWTTYGRNFIIDLVNGDYSYSESDLSLYAAELVQTLGTGGYFVPGYENMALTDVVDTFMSGVGAMMYANVNYVAKLSALYDSGEIGWFSVPSVDGRVGTGSNFPTHGGKGWAVSSSSYDSDPVLQDFIKYYFDHVDEESYERGALSWYNSDIPKGTLNGMMEDLAQEMKKQTVSWISWDDRLSAATTTAVGDAGAKLAYGAITPRQFCEIFDKNLVENDL